MSRRRTRTYLALTIMGGIALLVDRTVVSRPEGPTPVLATTRAPATGERAGHATLIDAPMSSDQTPQAEAIPEVPFPRGLPSPSPQDFLRDLFAPPGNLTGEKPDASDKAKDDSRPAMRPDQLGRDAFSRRHRLEGVILHLNLKTAIVNGIWIRVGQSIDGCRLVDLMGNEARFECYDGSVVLRVMDVPGTPNN